jgi:hypothetical protein
VTTERQQQKLDLLHNLRCAWQLTDGNAAQAADLFGRSTGVVMSYGFSRVPSPAMKRRSAAHRLMNVGAEIKFRKHAR